MPGRKAERNVSAALSLADRPGAGIPSEGTLAPNFAPSCTEKHEQGIHTIVAARRVAGSGVQIATPSVLCSESNQSRLASSFRF
jgi:hypothetical protein